MKILSEKSIKDADYIDFYVNEKLHTAAKKWADETNNLTDSNANSIVLRKNVTEVSRNLPPI